MLDCLFSPRRCELDARRAGGPGPPRQRPAPSVSFCCRSMGRCGGFAVRTHTLGQEQRMRAGAGFETSLTALRDKLRSTLDSSGGDECGGVTLPDPIA